MTPEAAGANCAYGGQLVAVGLDNGDGGETADDGVLGAGEVDDSDYVCNGADGADGISALSVTSDEPAGSNCYYGGTRTDIGLDDGAGGGTAGNDVLESGEIRATFFNCIIG